MSGIWVLLGLAGALTACETDVEEIGTTLRKSALCAVGGAAGYFAGDYLADKFAQYVAPEYQDQGALKAAFIVGTTLAMCGAVVYVGESIYKNLSERGRENREKAINEALNSTESRTYEDPENPSYRGMIEVVEVKDDVGEDCRLVEDTLASEESSEKVYTEYCRTADGGWEPQLIG